MKHLLPFLAGLIAFMVISSIYYMGIVAYPSSACVVPEDQMQANFGMMLLGNALMVGLAAHLIQLGGQLSAAAGVRQGAIAGLTANGILNVFVFGFFTCEGGHIFSMTETIQDIVANVVMMAGTGAVIGIMYARGAAKTQAA